MHGTRLAQGSLSKCDVQDKPRHGKKHFFPNKTQIHVLCVSLVESIDLQKIGEKEKKEKSLVLPQSEKHYPWEHSLSCVPLRVFHSGAIACTVRALTQGTSPTLETQVRDPSEASQGSPPLRGGCPWKGKG